MHRQLNNTLAFNEGNIKMILMAFYNIFREHPLGVRSDQVCDLVSKKIGYPFNYKDFHCKIFLSSYPNYRRYAI